MYNPEDVIGTCPKCGGDITRGKYGPYCIEKCGMSVARALGKELTEEQVADLLEGKRILAKGLRSRKGGTYDAYLTPEGIAPNNYTRKDGTEANGFQFKFRIEFPDRDETENADENGTQEADDYEQPW